MTLLKQQLSNFVNKDILVVQVDGNAFKGKLLAYDDSHILMENMIQTSTTQRSWFTVTVAVPKENGDSDRVVGGTVVGDSNSKLLKLKTAILSIDHITRVWLWTPELMQEGSDFDL